ncbi:MAG: cbb3-type cytochrome oxidase assembly protein CcoS [Xanthomonadaceae bacterium]|nr:cbb3-type cytochrome oxidase assembly protein CcoS [Xanthomonadaceae bacterium]MDE1964313.1 cbb3-type cytochrome oxidase assembly protein CcoS [Xanthomonadaceae bacterium]
MNIILVLIPVTLLVVVIAVALFFWAVNHQQFDDLENPGILPLLEDDPDQGRPPAPAPSSTPEDAAAAAPEAHPPSA